MKSRHLALIFGAILFAAGPASACRGVFSHTYILLDDPPSRLPDRAVLLQVSVSGSAKIKLWPDPLPVRARILSASNKRLIGKTVTISNGGVVSSCDRWASSPTANYVVGFLTKVHGKQTLAPVIYRSKPYRTEGEDRSEGVRSPPFKFTR